MDLWMEKRNFDWKAFVSRRLIEISLLFPFILSFLFHSNEIFRFWGLVINVDRLEI